ISFDESDDEDYTVVFDKNSFSYKIISTNDLKTNSENYNEKVNKPLFPSPEPTISCIDDLDFFKDFENEFPAIVYNDALTSKSNFSTEPTLCPQHIDEFDFKDETSLSKYGEEEQNVLYYNDLFPFNIIYHDDLKSDKGNDDNKIDMIQSSRGNENTQGSNELLEESHDKINKVFIIKSFVTELNVNIVAWNYFVNGMLFNLIKNLYVPFGIPFDHKRYYKDGDCERMLRRPRYLRLFDSRRKQEAMISGGQFVARLAKHFGLLTKERLQGLTVIVRDLPVIDMAKEEGDAREVTDEALVAPGGGDEDEEMPQAVPPPPRTQGERIARLEEELHGIRKALQVQKEVLDSMAHDSSRTKTGSKFSTIVCEYVTEPGALSKSKAELRRESYFKTSLKAKKSMKLVKYQSSGILCVIVVMLSICFVIPDDVEEDNHDLDVAHMDNDPYFGIPIPEVPSDQSSSTDSIHIIPDGFVDPDNPNHVYKLKKALYRLKQALRAWYDMLSSFLISQDFSKGSVDPTLFIHRKGKELLLVQIYIDDIIFAASTPDLCDLFAKIIFDSCDPVDTPMVEKSKLNEDKEGKSVDPSHYRGMNGTLLYLTASRPSLQFSICMCARYQARPTEKHLHAVKRIFRYLRGTINRGLCTSGSMQFLENRLVSWSSKRQKSAVISSTEAEYIAMFGCCAQILWMRSQLTYYSLGFNKIPMYCDNKSAIALCCNNVHHSRSKHIDIRFHFIKEHVENGVIELYFVNTVYQLADIFTKALARERIEFLINKLEMRSFTPKTLNQLVDEVDE
ncbi:retrovirus-related pol polyprotein from transposon TNT 1-94, partial [Tanacetum coccineum]